MTMQLCSLFDVVEERCIEGLVMKDKMRESQLRKEVKGMINEG